MSEPSFDGDQTVSQRRDGAAPAEPPPEAARQGPRPPEDGSLEMGSHAGGARASPGTGDSVTAIPGEEPTGPFLEPVRAAAPSRERPPSIPGYEILGELGRGGMGVVYQALQFSPRRSVALKLMRAGAHPEMLARFREEANAAARLSHANIVQIYEVGEHEGRPYLCLEFVAGVSLAHKIQGTPQPAREAAALVETLARAMHQAHERGVIHRDLKPANVLLATDGTPKVADFGLARLLDADQTHTETGEVLGTPSYMAPEQAWGKSKLRPVGPYTDVYALGAILYTLLTARPPFLADSPLETVQLVASDEEPVPPSRLQPKVPRDLETICLKCLRKKPAERYVSAEALAEDLRRFQDGRPVLARPLGKLTRAWRWCRRHPARALLLLVLVVSLAAVSLSLWEARHQLEVAEQRYHERHEAVNKYFTVVSENLLLNEPGLQPLRRELLEMALQSYQGFLEERGDDATLRAEVGRAYRRVGQITVALGSTAAALAAYRRALALQEQLREADPDAVGPADDLALTCEALGHLLKAERRPDEGLPLLRKARDLREWLAARGSGHFQGLLGDSLNDLTVSHLSLGQPEQALDAIEKAVPLCEQLVHGRPASAPDKSRLANAYHNKGLVLEVVGRVSEALAAYRKARDLQKELVRNHPRLTQYRAHLATHLGALGNMLANGAHYGDADAALKEALDLRRKLVEENPDVRGFQHYLAVGHLNLGRLCVKRGRYEEARDSLRQAADVLDRLLARTDSFELLRDAATAFHFLGTVQLKAGQRAEAEHSFHRGGELLARLVRDYPVLAEDRNDFGEMYFFQAVGLFTLQKGDRGRAAFEQVVAHWAPVVEKMPWNAQRRQELNMSYFTLGKLMRDDGRPADAARLARERRKLWPRVPDQVHDAACELAMCAAVVGKGKIELTAAERSQREVYCKQAIGFLREALALGLSNPETIAGEGDFTVLRSRLDFQALLRELGAKKGKGG